MTTIASLFPLAGATDLGEKLGMVALWEKADIQQNQLFCDCLTLGSRVTGEEPQRRGSWHRVAGVETQPGEH